LKSKSGIVGGKLVEGAFIIGRKLQSLNWKFRKNKNNDTKENAKYQFMPTTQEKCT
jgi:hypothetical protein